MVSFQSFRVIALSIFAVTLVLLVPTAQAEHTDHTFVGGISSRPDSQVYLALASGAYVYTPLYLTIGADYSCNYTILYNNTIYQSGYINVSEAGIIDITVDFDKGGLTDLKVVIGMDSYNYRINVLKRSYESAVITNTTVQDILAQYQYSDLISVFGGTIAGLILAVVLAYWFKVNKIKQETRRLL